MRNSRQVGEPSTCRSLIDEIQSECVFQQSIYCFFGADAPKSNRIAIAALQLLEHASFYEDLMVDNRNESRMHRRYLWDHLQFNSVSNSYTDAVRNYANFLFEENQFIPFLIFSYNNPIYSPKQWESYAHLLANGNCVEAHVFLAYHYSWDTNHCASKIKQHLRVAADAGHSDARSMYRRVFGENMSTPNGVRVIE